MSRIHKKMTTMKKLYFFAVCLAVAAVSVSCQKAQPEGGNLVPFSVTFGIEEDDLALDIDSKTLLASGTQKFGTGTKYLSLFTTDGERVKLSSSSSTQDVTRTFTGEVPEGKTAAYYFYSGGYEGQYPTWKGNGQFKVVDNKYQRIKNEQPAYNGSFELRTNPLIAKPSDSALRNIMGYIKWINPKGEDGDKMGVIASVKFEALTSGEYLTGVYFVDYSGADPVVTPATPDVDNYVISTSYASGSRFDLVSYAVVFPGTYHGLKMTITLRNGTVFTLKHPGDITIERGKAINLGALPTAPLQ